MLWSQTDIWKLKPIIIINDDLEGHVAATTTHLSDLTNYYINNSNNNNNESPSIYVVNLIDKKEKQGELGNWLIESFENINDNFTGNKIKKLRDKISGKQLDRSVTSSSDYKNNTNNIITRLIWFDYHYKVKGKKIDKFKEIYTKLKDCLDSNSLFFVSNNNNNNNNNNDVLQNTIIRTNCIDCLDRTNVIQVK